MYDVTGVLVAVVLAFLDTQPKMKTTRIARVALAHNAGIEKYPKR